MKTAKIKEHLHHLNRLINICACCLFLISVLSPFLSIWYHSIIPENSFYATYWSYKDTVSPILSLMLGYVETYWFGSYWFAERKPYSYPTPITLGVSWVLVIMLSMQVLTLWSGLSTLFSHRRFPILPLISCFSVMFLMTYVTAQVRKQTYSRPEYELGYWLCYLSVILFLLAFLVSYRAKQSSPIAETVGQQT